MGLPLEVWRKLVPLHLLGVIDLRALDKRLKVQDWSSFYDWVQGLSKLYRRSLLEGVGAFQVLVCDVESQVSIELPCLLPSSYFSLWKVV